MLEGMIGERWEDGGGMIGACGITTDNVRMIGETGECEMVQEGGEIIDERWA